VHFENLLWGKRKATLATDVILLQHRKLQEPCMVTIIIEWNQCLIKVVDNEYENCMFLWSPHNGMSNRSHSLQYKAEILSIKIRYTIGKN
jgi:hypothetical protein